MSWFHASTTARDARNHASAAEIVACFRDQRNLLDRLAFLISADEASAEQAVAQACDHASGKQSFPGLASRVGQGCDHCRRDIAPGGCDSRV
jgi:hypothetical protein